MVSVKRVAALFALGLCCLAPVAVRAADDKPNEIGVLLGAGVTDKNMSPDDKREWGPLVGLRFAHFGSEHWAFFADGTYSKYSVDVLDDDVKITTLRMGPEYYFGQKGKKARWFIAGGAGWEWIDFPGDNGSRGLVSLGGGQRFGTGPNHFSWQLRLDKTLGSSGVASEKLLNAQFLLGYAWGFGGPPKDTDGDGVRDRLDKCPDTPKGAKVDVKGCPLDGDGDGVFDGLDKCPDTPKGWPVDATGCPKDTDGDGVPDGADKCPDTPKGAKVDATGCPLDGDKDGVFDGLDKCPDTPAGWPVNADGCSKDSDGDGVPDGADKCPDTPKGTKVDKTGCPLPPPEPPKAEPLFSPTKKVLVLEGVNFEVDKAVLKPESLAILDKVATSLHDWPEVKVEVGGHTDSTGPRAHNMELSNARAKAVKDYLVSKGIDASRMTTAGYGPDKPIADNAKDVGRAKNRRVELKKLD